MPHWRQRISFILRAVFYHLVKWSLWGGNGVECGRELIHSAAYDFWNGVEIKSSSEVICITFSFLLSHIVPFEKCDMVGKVYGQKEHQTMKSLLCHVVYNVISRAAWRLMALFGTALPSSFHLGFTFFLTWVFCHLANMLCCACLALQPLSGCVSRCICNFTYIPLLIGMTIYFCLFWNPWKVHEETL